MEKRYTKKQMKTMFIEHSELLDCARELLATPAEVKDMFTKHPELLDSVRDFFATPDEIKRILQEHPDLFDSVKELLKEEISFLNQFGGDVKLFSAVVIRYMFTKHPEIVEVAREYFREGDRKKYYARKADIERARAEREKMTPEQKIAFLNTPYEKMPDNLKAGMTKHPTTFNFMRIEQPHLGPQQETAGSRIVRFRNDYDMSREDFKNICNIFAKQFKIRGPRGLQQTKLTMKDILNYEDQNVSPKTDKLFAMTRAMGMPLAYFTGYTDNPPALKSHNETIESRYRKKREKIINETPEQPLH